MPSTLRVANASGYWGDDPGALARQVRGGSVDDVTLDFLAEITMVILQRQRARDPGLGYAYDFVAMLGPVLPEIYTRSGDKGDHANIGVAARSPAAFAVLRRELGAERVRRHFGDLCGGPVERYELPGRGALNFVLRHALGGGGTLSLRADHQGKTLAQGLLGLELEVPEPVLAATAPDGEG
jgi:hypothetical protein